MNSATLTEPADASRAPRPSSSDRDTPFAGVPPWQIYALLGMLAAAAAVWVSRHTHPLALVLLSAAAMATALVALTIHRAVAALLGGPGEIAPLRERQREILEKEKLLVLRSIKELEFDRAMGKIDDADFTEIVSHLRARALTLMQDLERAAQDRQPDAPRRGAGARRVVCGHCETTNDSDAKFCKACGKTLS
jgi:hypothetical protein